MKTRTMFSGLMLATVLLPVFADAPKSGLSIGKHTPAFNPMHATGADKGSQTCPV